MQRWAAILFFFCFLLPNKVTASAQIRIEQLHYMEDSTRNLTLTQILQNRNWRSIAPEDGFSGGFTQSVQWFKLSIANDMPAVAVLSMLSPTLYDVRLYLPENLGLGVKHGVDVTSTMPGWMALQQGAVFPHNYRDHDWRGFSFNLNLMEPSRRDVYVRVDSGGPNLVTFRIDTEEEFSAHARTEYALFGLFLGGLLMFAAVAAAFYWIFRGNSHLDYLRVSTAAYFYTVTLEGLLGQFVLSDYPVVASRLIPTALALDSISLMTLGMRNLSRLLSLIHI